MQWNEILPVSLAIEPNASVEKLFSDADLVVISVTAPAPEGDEDDEEKACEDDKEPEVMLSGFAKQVDESKLGGALTALLSENSKSFKNGAKLGATAPTLRMMDGGGRSQRVVVLGLGTDPKAQDEETGQGKKKEDPLLGAGHALGKAIAAKCDSEKKVTSVKVVLPVTFAGSDDIMKDFAAGFYQSLYSDNRFRTGAKVQKVAEHLKSVTILSEGDMAASSSAIDAGKKVAMGVILTKDIVNCPHNVLSSLGMANTARRM